MKVAHFRIALPRLVYGLMAGCLLVAGCSKDTKEGDPVVAVQAVAAQKGEISRMVSAEAVIFPIAQSAITPKINAPVKTATKRQMEIMP